MAVLVLDPHAQKALIRERRRSGVDRFDEVWDGVYIMSPPPDNEHQRSAYEFSKALEAALSGVAGITAYPTCTVSDRVVKWTKNYRVPDVAVFLPGNPAEDKGTHWLGGPDFAVEVISPNDRSRKKLDFYAKVGVRELLLVDRKPWSLELYLLVDGALKLAGKIDLSSPHPLASSVLPVSFRILPGSGRPRVEISQSADGRRWLI